MNAAPPLLPLVERFVFPRLSGGEGERRAADLVAAEFAAAGLPVMREPFEASTRAISRVRALVSLFAGALVLLAGFFTASRPWLAAIAGAAFLATVALSGRWPRLLERFFDARPRLSSENVVARRPPRRPPAAATSSSTSRPHVVLLAHLDSKSSRDATFFTVALLLGATAIAAVLFIRAALAMAGLVSAPPLALTLPLAVFAVAALGRALVNPSGDESPGAMDNASGLAVLVDAARTYPRAAALDAVDFTFLATGAEEIGLAGAMRWIQTHGGELDPARTLFVNVDSVGVGRGLFALDVHGRTPDGAKLPAVLRAAASTAGVKMHILAGLPGVGVDTMPIAARGFATVTVLGRVLGGASRRIHTSRDTIEVLGEGGMDDARRFVRALVERVADGV